MLRRSSSHPAWVLTALVAAITLGVAVSLSAGRWFTTGQRTSALAPEPSTSATPRPGETPDFAQDFWYQKWLNQDSTRERRDIVVNGIAVGPTVNLEGSPCEDNRPVDVDFAEAQTSRVAIELAYQPAGTTVVPQDAVACGGKPVANGVRIDFPAVDDRALDAELKQGQSFFDLPHGGDIEVLRIVASPAWGSSIPVERWQTGTVAGIPAAIGRPILEEGFGDGEVIVHHEGVLTVVRGVDVSLSELIRVAEGVLR